MKPSTLILGLSLQLACLAPAFAGECVVHTTRTACPGMETESYSKCDGKQSCDSSKEAPSAALCTSLAKKACDNNRFEITRYKRVTASYDGAPLNDGKDFCVDRIDAFPFMKKEVCK
jgi:hypothetical protein